MFSPGDLVVCVDAADWGNGFGLPPITNGHIYTVVEVFDDQVGGYEGVVLAEVSAAPTYGFAGHRFRPVDRNKISIFTDMLAPQEIERAKELIRLEDAVEASLTEVDEIAAAEAIERDISG